MAKTVLGKVGMTPRGSYSNVTEYKRLDVVTYDGCSYVCLKTCTGIAVTNTEYWQLIAEKGIFTEQDKESFKQAVVAESKTEMDTYTNGKKTEIDNYVEDCEDDLKSSLDSYETAKETELNGVASDNISAFNRNAESKTSDFNTNATNKTNEFNTNATTKTTEFNDNATEKIEDFNTNAESKTNDFNSNVTNKTEDFDNSASQKTLDFNNNAVVKTNEFNENADEVINTNNKITKLIDTEFDTNTAEGTTIDVDDSAEWDGSILIGGNTEQKQLSGKNKLDSSKIEQTTKNGITCSYDENTHEITFNGTCTTDNTVFNFLSNKLEITAQKTNFCAFCTGGSVSGYLRIRFFDGGYYRDTTLDLSDISKEKNVIMQSRYNYNSTLNSIRIDQGAICNNFRIKIMVTDDDNTDFEEYCGGQPSPNPNYTQEIKVVKGANVIKHVGKNLCKKYVNGDATYQYGYSIYVDADFEVGKKYVISFIDKSVGNSYYRNESFMINPSSYSITSTGKRQNYYFECKNIDKNNKGEYAQGKGYILLKNYSALAKLPQFEDIEIEEVESYDFSTISYEPYKERLYELDFSKKNKFDVNKSILNTYIQNSGTTGDSNVSNLSNYVKVKANQNYTISFKCDSFANSDDRSLVFYDNDKQYISGQKYKVTDKVFSITPTQSGYIRFAYDINCYNIQFEEGTVATEYEEYNSMEICKIKDNNGNVVAQDRIIYENGNFQVEKNVTKFINNGTGQSNFKLVTSYIAENLLACVFNLDHKKLGSVIAIICDKMTGKYLKPDGDRTDSNNVRNAEGIALHNDNTNQIVCSVKKSRLQEESIGGIAQFFAENPLTMYVPALETTYEPITDQTLISQLEALLKVQMYHGVNHFYVETDNLEPVMELTYKQSNKIKNEKQNARLDNIESRLALLE